MTDELREPQTADEWQRAADAASSLLVLEALQIPPPGTVRICRAKCEEVLARAHELGIEPRPNALGQYVAERAAYGTRPDPDADLRGVPPR